MTAQTVLVIDDERDIRELLTITLGRMDLQVEAVGTVAEAQHALGQRTYDLCFTDMRLPDGSGQQIIELLFESTRASGATLVLITHDPALAERCDRIVHIADGIIVGEDAAKAR